MKNVFISQATQAEDACKRGDFEKAILIYSECIKSDPENPVLLSNRSAAYVKNKQYELALDDGQFAAGINPNWPKVIYFLFCVRCIFHPFLISFDGTLNFKQESQAAFFSD